MSFTLLANYSSAELATITEQIRAAGFEFVTVAKTSNPKHPIASATANSWLVMILGLLPCEDLVLTEF